MKCEICNAIERLGLDPSAHDLWYCSAPERHTPGRLTRATVETFLVEAALLPRVACDLLIVGCKHLLVAGMHSLSAYRRHYITLGL